MKENGPRFWRILDVSDNDIADDNGQKSRSCYWSRRQPRDILSRFSFPKTDSPDKRPIATREPMWCQEQNTMGGTWDYYFRSVREIISRARDLIPSEKKL